MVVQHNLTAMNANRMLGITTGQQSKATEKLSSGYRINRAADDAAGLTISEKMRKQIRGLDQASTNAQDGVSAVQTAEGALTEVHSMLQRMNELAVQASNGTNSEADRGAIQDEIAQLETEIDRVAETTKFNEIYLLKGSKGTTTKYIDAHDAGIKGELVQSASGATFDVGTLAIGDSIEIGGQKYSIGGTPKNAQDLIDQALADASTDGADKTFDLDGNTYTVTSAGRISVGGANLSVTGANDAAGDLAAAKALVLANSKIKYGTEEIAVMTDVKDNATGVAAPDGIDDVDPTVISAAHAYELIAGELTKANSIGTDTAATIINSNNGTFTITKGTVEIPETLSFNLHVGADADMTNKIAVDIDSMSAAGLGIKGINVKDDTGMAATYAIDAIADALSTVSAQRSALGAVQNRLEHTIANVDNVVENTTAAESRIRDTDMAEMMVEYSKNNILAQAGQSMLAQANQSTQGVLSLLQ